MDMAGRGSDADKSKEHEMQDVDAWLAYNGRIEGMRELEYPMLKDAVYLDHAGTTLYSKTQIESFSADMLSNLYGNTHSGSVSSQLATCRIDDIRLQVLQFFGADPAHFDLVFVANATAGVKLVAEAFRDQEGGFWYGYHKDSHTSLVGMREVASHGHRCFVSDDEVELWLHDQSLLGDQYESELELFEYPAQSNMDGRRLPLHWTGIMRRADRGRARKRYTLLDAAAYASTAPLNFCKPDEAPDFTVVSFNKIFGFPDLGGLIVRNKSSNVLTQRKYFGGGTVDMVLCLGEQWHAKKTGAVHETLEDGTLPIHSIVALGAAMNAHHKLFGNLYHVSRHTRMLADHLATCLSDMVHGNGVPVCQLYRCTDSGPIVSLNIQNANGEWISNAEVEKLAATHSFHVRSGGLCNPGGMASTLGLKPWEMKANFSQGFRCGEDQSTRGNKPSGMLRLSLGAMSTLSDIERFAAFVKEYFVEQGDISQSRTEQIAQETETSELFVESLTIYPLKSCAGWHVPTGMDWPVRAEGLGWDREWCLVHRGTSKALNQKKYPKMALMRPEIDLQRASLRIRYSGHWIKPGHLPNEVEVPLFADSRPFEEDNAHFRPSIICSDSVALRKYKSAAISEYFSVALGVPCQLARFPPASSVASQRHAKAHNVSSPLLCSNESPILVITRPSLDRLNEDIKARRGQAAGVESFRANIVIAQALHTAPRIQQAYAEDVWSMLRIGGQLYQLLGLCRRCQMVCIDQETGERRQEPFATLAKTRRFEGKVWFGRHACHVPQAVPEAGASTSSPPAATIRVGEAVRVEHGWSKTTAESDVPNL